MSSTPTHFLLCPTCCRSVPASTAEKYCPNDGTKLLEGCPCCERPILTPFARFCAGCGFEFATAVLANITASPLRSKAFISASTAAFFHSLRVLV